MADQEGWAVPEELVAVPELLGAAVTAVRYLSGRLVPMALVGEVEALARPVSQVIRVILASSPSL